MRLLVCGSTEFTDRDKMTHELAKIGWKKVKVVIHGDARGADRMAGEIAKLYKKRVKKFPAKWKLYGRAAGPIRNQKMLDKGKPNFVLAFPMENSVGTWDMVMRAKKAGVKVRVIK